ncbi:MAG: hypothetical protein ABL877_13555 [Thiobacillus sp.]
MSSGLMSLAYLGELGVVFNLAYIELKKTRYIEQIKQHLAETKKVIEVVEASNEQQMEMFSLNHQIDDMLSKDNKARKKAWLEHKNNGDGTHHDIFAGYVFNFFDIEKDKDISQFLLCVAAFSIPVLTIFNYYDWNVITFANYGHLDAWWTFFWLFVLTNLIPGLFVYTGRGMKETAMKCTESVKMEYTKIGQKMISNAIESDKGSGSR